MKLTARNAIKGNAPFGIEKAELLAHFAPVFEFEEGWVPAKNYPSRTGREWVAVFRRSNTSVAIVNQ